MDTHQWEYLIETLDTRLDETDRVLRSLPDEEQYRTIREELSKNHLALHSARLHASWQIVGKHCRTHHMLFLEKHDALRALCQARCCWGIYFRLFCKDEGSFIDELLKAAPWLKDLGEKHEHYIGQWCHDEMGILLFEHEHDMWKVYHMTVGDDGPTKTNPYNGPARVYCLTCNPKGELEHENT